MGVSVTFKTTLARVPENGLPVLLGSSQAQIVTTLDGLASIVPSAGNVGPCDVFITVSAGGTTAQFHMESVAAIVLSSPPKNGRPKTPPALRGPQFGAPTAALQIVPDMLFAVPEGDPGNEPASVANASACTESPADEACRDRSGPAPASPESENSAPPPSAKSKPAKVPKKVVRAKRDVAAVALSADTLSADTPGADATSKVQTQSQSSLSTSFPKDKRSCQVLAGNALLF